MSDVLKFTVRGEPRGKGRARAYAEVVWRDGNPEAVVRLVTPQDTVGAEQLVRDEFLLRHPRHSPWTGPVMIRFTAVFETPRSFNKALQAAAASGKLYCTKKPDKDNIEKLIIDALNGIAWADDQQVMGGGVKRYGTPARIDVEIRKLDDPQIPATPGQKRTERRMGVADPLQPQLALSGFPTKSGKRKHPPALQSRIEAALERDERQRRTTTSQYRKERQ